MGIKQVNPTTPGRRGANYDDFADLTTTTPHKSLLKTRKKNSGRNNQGKITIRHRGGGAKQNIRIIDYKRDRFEIPAKVVSIEYDPIRGARVALIQYVDGVKTYIIAPVNLKVDDKVISSKSQIEYKPGNAMPLKYLQAGIAVYNVELVAGKGGKVARGAGCAVFVMGIEGKYAQVKMPSSEIRLFDKECLCTIGQASNPDRRLIKIGKAGRMRHKGIRPTVRGSAMNPTDHPHGGGEGNQSIGLKRPKTPWGKAALGVKTRKLHRTSNKFILHRRKKNK
ncbi:MAG: 50S ribosomal protein L2 [Candidatus Falkowbacteria bacterium]|nr:50S ribosomal protein L2 [Candidatus Falkowbacteria bacterium]